MKFLFLHQNFPAQFRQLVDHLAADPAHELIALRQPPVREYPGVGMVAYPFLNKPRKDIHPLLAEMEAKVLRGESVAAVCLALRDKGWNPDVIVAHPGWGEALFVREIWPFARLVVYCEYFYRAEGQDFNCDPEFPQTRPAEAQQLKLKNAVMLHALSDADAAYAPTQWQRATFPAWAQDKIAVVHEGIDTDYFKPDTGASFTITNKKVHLEAGDEVITFAARSLEPVRGFHTFMRALPQILEQRKNAHVVIMGQQPASYGMEPKGFPNWQAKMLAEVGKRLDPRRVHLVGFLPKEQYRAVLQVSRVHVYLTYPFLLSWSMLEAMSCGALIVGSDTGPVREIITHGENGMLAPLLDPTRLAQCVVDQLKLPATKAAKMRAAAREWVKQHYATEDCLTNTLALVAPGVKSKTATKTKAASSKVVVDSASAKKPAVKKTVAADESTPVAKAAKKTVATTKKPVVTAKKTTPTRKKKT